MPTQPSIQLTQNRYGKRDVRLVKVTPRDGYHVLQELSVNVLLTGAFEATYLTGDNSPVLPTDTIKNTIYALAREHELESIEQFAIDVSRHFQERLDHVETVEVEVTETLWQRMTVDGKPHPHAFTGSNSEKATCAVLNTAEGITVHGGIVDLVILKTTGSGFSNFLKDEYTTLEETDDRLLGTNLLATWLYRGTDVPFGEHRATIRETLLDVFADYNSDSLQQTLYEMGKAVLAQIPDLADIHLVMPNRHNLLVNLAPFGQENPNSIFLPINEPAGLIEGYLQAE